MSFIDYNELENLKEENALLKEERDSLQLNYQNLHHDFAELSKDLQTKITVNFAELMKELAEDERKELIKENIRLEEERQGLCSDLIGQEHRMGCRIDVLEFKNEELTNLLTKAYDVLSDWIDSTKEDDHQPEWQAASSVLCEIANFLKK